MTSVWNVDLMLVGSGLVGLLVMVICVWELLVWLRVCSVVGSLCWCRMFGKMLWESVCSLFSVCFVVLLFCVVLVWIWFRLGLVCSVVMRFVSWVRLCLVVEDSVWVIVSWFFWLVFWVWLVSVWSWLLCLCSRVYVLWVVVVLVNLVVRLCLVRMVMNS